MKSLLLSIIIFLFAILSVFSQTVVFHEGFENLTPPALPSGWTQEKVVGATLIDWETLSGGHQGNPTDYAYQGDYNAIFQYESSNGQATKLITPVIDLTDVIKPELRFAHAQDIWYSGEEYWDQLKIYYKRGEDSVWVMLEEYLYPVTSWENRIILLPDSSLSSTYYIAFEGITGYGHGVLIDTVHIVETGVIPLYIESVNIRQTNTSFIPTGTNNNPVLRVEFNVLGNNGTLTLDSISINSLNTSDDDIVTNGVKLYYTEDTIFSSGNLIATSNFSSGIVNFDNLNHSLPRGITSMWLTYDIKEDLNHYMYGNIADAMVKESAVKIDNSYYPFIDKSPSGYRVLYESIFIDDFETNKGWRFTGEFERAIPQGLHANSLGNADPDTAYSGSYVIGTDLTLDGNYSDGLSDTAWVAQIPTLNLKYYKDITFTYYRWLNIQNYAADQAKILVSTEVDTLWDIIWHNPELSIISDNLWSSKSFDLSEYFERNDNAKIKFTLGKTNSNSNYTGWNIDDVIIVGNYITKDVGITDWLAPLDGCGHNTNEEYVEITIQNYAGEILTNPLPVSYSFDGGATIKYDTITNPNIAIDGSINYIIDKPVDLSTPGWYNNVYATTHLPGDEDNTNNRINKSIFITPTYDLPYFENFETNYGYYLSGGRNSTWEYGTPAGTLIDAAASGTKAWVTNLTGEYETDDSSYFESPCFNFAGTDSIVFEFKCKGLSEDKTDGLSLLYSTDEGTTWNLVPDDNDFYWNWYTETLISALALPGIDETAGEWLIFRQLLPPVLSNNSSAKFKFVFGSNESTNYEGFGIDDIKIYEAPYDVGVSSLAYPYNRCEWSDTTHVKIYVENYGITPVKSGTKIPLSLNFESEITRDTLTLASDLAVNGTVLFTFGSTVDMSYAGDYDFKINTKLESNTYFYNETLSNDTLYTSVTVQGMPNYEIGWIVGSDDVDTLLDATSGYTNYSWHFGGGEVATTQTYRATEEGIYYVTVTNADGCTADDSLKVVQSTIDVKMDSIRTAPKDSCQRFELTEIKAAIANIGLILNVDDTIPFGYQVNNLPPVLDTLTLTSQITTTHPNDTVTFTFDDKCDLTEPGEYTISVFTNFASDLNRNNDTITVTINTWGLPDVDLAYDTIYSSQADTLTLDAGPGFASYNWNTGVSTQTITPGNVSYYYKVTVTDTHSCGSDKDSTYIETHDLGISAVTSPTDICEDLASATTSINVEVTNYSDSVYSSSNVKIFYKYDTDDWVEVNPVLNVGASGSVTINNISTIDATAVGEHTLKLYTSSDIDANHSNDTLEYSFETWPLPHVDLAYDTIFTTRADTVILIAQPGFATYNWSDGSTNDTLVVSKKYSEEYVVTVTDEHGCGSDKDTTQIITYNFSINSLITPKNACEHTSTETVMISVKNSSHDTLQAGTIIPVGYILNNNPAVNENFTLNSILDPFQTANYSFTNKVDVSEINTYKFTLYTAFDLDVNNANDTLVDAIKTFGYPEIELGDDIYTTEPETVSLVVQTGFTAYDWNDGSTNSTLNVTYPASRLYSVTVTDINGCTTNDDINVYTYDVAASNLVTPFSQCELSDTEDVNFDIVNSSQDTLLIGETIDVRYILNSGSLVSESFNLADTLFPAETVNHTFAQQADLSVNQVHELKVFAKLSSIDVELDDTITSNVDYQKPDFDLGADVNIGTEEYTITAETGYSSYLWFDNTTTTNTYTVNVNNQNPNYYYAVTVTNSDGCSADDSIQVTFTTTPDLELTSMTTPVSACWNESETYPVHIVITNSGVVNLNPGGSFIVGYRIDGGTAVTETYNLTTAMNANDTREHTFTDSALFASAKIYEFKTFVKHAEDGDVSNDTLTTNIDISAPVVDLGPDTVYFTDTYEITSSENYDYYLWSDGSTESTLVVSETGTYSVTVTDAIGCQGEGSIYCEKYTGIDNLIQGDGYKITYYPNPVSEKLIIQFDNKKSTDVIIEIISTNGQVLYNNKLSNIENTIERIDVNPYANGVYYLRFRINQDFYIRKLIIQ